MNKLILNNLLELQAATQTRAKSDEREEKKLKSQAEGITKNFKELVETAATARALIIDRSQTCLLYTSPSPRDS